MIGQLVSIIVPCFNQAHYLDECLESVINQTYTNWECIIVNDGSPDQTAEVAKQWVEKDSRFIYLKKENGGLSSARNAGISLAQGVYILPLDADDKISYDYLELGIREFNKNLSLKVVYCQAEKFGTDNIQFSLKEFSLKKLAFNNMIFCSAFFKKKDWKEAGGYDETMIHGFEDWDFWITLLKNDGEVKRIEKTCFYYRSTPNSMSSLLNETTKISIYRYLSLKHADFYISQMGSFHEINERLVKADYFINYRMKNSTFLFKTIIKNLFQN